MAATTTQVGSSERQLAGKPLLKQEGAEFSLANALPPAFIVSMIATIWSSYSLFHLLPMFQLEVDVADRDMALVNMGWIQTAISQYLSVLMCISYVRSILTHPGTGPSGGEWTPGAEVASACTFELKGSGEKRCCKWCSKYKPDRCHHCRVCKTCILKMDHHCPWIMNCVGFRNHKFFFLMVIYSVLTCAFMGVTVVKSVLKSAQTETNHTVRFFLVLCLVLCALLFLITSVFLAFHLWLLGKGMTTIEFCEKNLSSIHRDKVANKGYDGGLAYNLKVVFGPQPLLWMFPVLTLVGDGIHFPPGGDGTDGAPDPERPEWTGTLGYGAIAN